MAVNATEVLYLTSGLFKAVPSKAILTDLVKFNGNIDQLAATLGTSEFAINAFPFSNAEKAKLLAENLLGSTVADKAAAVTALEGILNANGGNVGIAAAAGIRAILTDAAFADAKAQLENRVKVAAAYVDSNKGNEISTSVLDAVTKDAATVTTAINSLTGTTGGNEAGADRVLTTAQDILTGTAGNDNFRAVAGANTGNQDQTTLNSSDIIDGAAGNDTLIVNLVNGGAAANYGGGARIKNIETLKLGTNNNATFDYNVNQGQNEITDVTTIVADQINTGETLTIRNLVRDTADKALPTLSWINDSTAVNGLAGTVNAAYRAAAVSGTADEQAINLTNVRAGTLNINAGIEKAVVASTGTSTNSIATIDSITGTNTTLKEVVINAEATAALGEGRIISTAAGTRGLEVARAPANDNTQHVSFVNVGSAVTKVDASGSKGNVNVAFTDTATAVANTFIGGEGNDQVVVNGGNDNLSGGKGNDTFIFGQTNTSANGTFFNNSDTIDGGEGTDTIQIDYAGTAALGQVVIQTSEWLNSKGLDALDLRAQNTRVQLDDAFVGRADAGSFEVITNKIVQNDSTTSVADEANSRHQIDLTTVTASRAVKVTGGEGRETVIVTDALNGVQTISGGNGLDALVVQNGATLTGQDLQNVSGINVFNLVKTSANAQSFQIDLTADFLTKAIDANAAAGTSKNTANAFRIVTDTRDTNAATISGVQTLAVGDSVTITVDTTDLSTVDAINVRDLIASGATINVRNTSGTTLLAAANGAVTTNTGIFAGVTGNNYNYTDLTTNPIAGVGTPVASGQASTGGGGVAPASGNTFTLTANNAVVTVGANSGTTDTAANPTKGTTANQDIINANLNLGTSFIQDLTTGDADILNAILGAASTATVLGVETLNLTGAGGSLSLAGVSGATAINLVTGAQTITAVGATAPININSGYAGAATIKSSTNQAGSSVLAVTSNGASSTAEVTFEASDNVFNSETADVVTMTVAAASTYNKLLAGGSGRLLVKGSADLTVATDVTFGTVVADSTYTGKLNLTYNTAGTNTIIGSAQADTFTFTAGFVGTNDVVDGGAGNDTLTVTGNANLTNVTNVENIKVNGTNSATVTTVANSIGLGQTLNIDGSGLTGAAALTTAVAGTETYFLNITGSGNGDTLVGSIQKDTISGGAGNDTITGGAGADTIDVGTGFDQVAFDVAHLGANRATAASDAGFAATADIWKGLTNGTGGPGVADSLAISGANFSGVSGGGASAGGALSVAAPTDLTATGALTFATNGVLVHSSAVGAAGTNAVVNGVVQTSFVTAALAVLKDADAMIAGNTNPERGFVLIRDQAGDGAADVAVFFINHTDNTTTAADDEIQFVGVLQDFGATISNGFFL